MRRFLQINYTIQGSDFETKEKIRALGESINPFQGSWIILTELTAQEAYNRIATNKPSDLFLVLDFKINTYWGVMPKETWDWLSQRKFI